MPLYEYIVIINDVDTVLPKALHELGSGDITYVPIYFRLSSISTAQAGNSLVCKAVICLIWDTFI